MDEKIVPVILCGGSGTRLWPASREDRPKQFLTLGGDLSLLQETALRALRVTGAEPSHIITVTLGKFAREVGKQLSGIDPAMAEHILSEPVARNTAPAVALAAAYAKETFGPDALLLVLPSDHYIGDEISLKTALDQAVPAARGGHLVTFGITPTRVETGYGYIRTGEFLPGYKVHAADAFVEKPDYATAQDYIQSGKYLWNAGMFLFSAGDVLREFYEHDNALVNRMATAVKTGTATYPDLAHYADLAAQPFDKSVMEKSSRVAVVPCDPQWSDIGSWESLWEISEKDKNGNFIDGRVACHNTKNCFIRAQDRLIACAGLKDIVIVETPDAILIADRRNTDAMKLVVSTLKQAGAREVQRELRQTEKASRPSPDKKAAA